MSVKRWKLGWKRCHLIECTSALTVEQTEEDCGWVHWREHKDEVARLKAEVETLKLGSLLTAVDVMAFIKLKEENSRLKEDVEMWKLRSDNWQKLCQMSKEGKPSV